MNVERNEYKYQLLKLVHSGRSLGEAKSLLKSVAVGLTGEYAKQSDIIDMLVLEGSIYKITSTRAEHQNLWKLKMTARSNLESSKEEVLSKFVTGYRGNLPLNWRRDGNLVRRGPPNRARPGSSKGKVGRTRIKGFKKVNKDLQELMTAIQNLEKLDSKYRKKNGLDKFVKSIQTKATANIN
jgi:hypothetical protein